LKLKYFFENLKKGNISVRNKLLTILIFVPYVSVTVFIFFVVFFYNNSKNKSNSEKAQIISETLIGKIDKQISESISEVQTISNILIIENTNNLIDNSLNSKLNNFILTHQVFDLFLICDTLGNVISINSNNYKNSPYNFKLIQYKNYAAENWFQYCRYGLNNKTIWFSDLKQNTDFSKIFLSSGNGIEYATPIFNSNSQPFTFSYLVDAESSKTQMQQVRTKTNTNTRTEFTAEVNASASFIRRSYAFIADISLVAVMLMTFIYGSILSFGTDTFIYQKITILQRLSNYGVSEVVVWFAGLFLVLSFFYFLYFEALLGQTPGKMFLNIMVVSNDEESKPSVQKSLLRLFLFFIPILGILGLHNRLSRTKIVTRG